MRLLGRNDAVAGFSPGALVPDPCICPATHSASRFAIVPPDVRCPRYSVHPNIPAISATASISMAELARPPSRAWLFGLIVIASAYAARATGCGGFNICPAYKGWK